MVFADWMTRILAIFTFIFSAVRVIELYEFYMLIKQYYNRLRDCRWHNWQEFLSRLFFETVRFFMFVFAIPFAAFFHFSCHCVTNGQWQVGVLAVFLGWINMITFFSYCLLLYFMSFLQIGGSILHLTFLPHSQSYSLLLDFFGKS